MTPITELEKQNYIDNEPSPIPIYTSGLELVIGTLSFAVIIIWLMVRFKIILV